jgi:hypothetical protein
MSKEMSTCKTCKHFEFPHWDGPPHLGRCKRWHVGYRVEEASVGQNEAWVEDDEGWGMRLGPDFGCVLHETMGSV